MKLTHLTIKEFMGIKAADMALVKPINLFAGPNESGKTSIRDSVLWALTGNARGLKNEEARRDLIRAGAKATAVDISFTENGTPNQAFSRRKTLNSPSTITGMMPAQNETVYILADVDKPALEITIKTRRAQRDELLKSTGRLEGNEEKLKEVEAALFNLVPADPPNPDRPVEDWVKALEINRSILEKLQKKITAMIAGSDPKTFPLVCPAYQIDCPSRGQVAISGTKPKDVDPAVLTKAQADLHEQEREVALIEIDLKATQTVQATYDGYCKQRDRLDAQVKELRAKGSNAHAAENLARLEAELVEKDNLLAAINDFWKIKDRADAALVMVEKCEAEANFYDVLQKALAPSGIPSQMISEALAPVNTLLAVAAAHLFPGRTLTLTPELDFHLEGAPILSKSAELRVGVAIQYVLARLAGARLLMVDEVDMLDPGNRANFVKFLRAVREDFDTIMAFTTAASANPAPVEDVQMWFVENGGVRALN